MNEFKTLKDIYNDLSVHSQQALFYDDEKLALGSKGINKKYISKEDLTDALVKFDGWNMEEAYRFLEELERD